MPIASFYFSGLTCWALCPLCFSSSTCSLTLLPFICFVLFADLVCKLEKYMMILNIWCINPADGVFTWNDWTQKVQVEFMCNWSPICTWSPLQRKTMNSKALMPAPLSSFGWGLHLYKIYCEQHFQLLATPLAPFLYFQICLQFQILHLTLSIYIHSWYFSHLHWSLAIANFFIHDLSLPL